MTTTTLTLDDDLAGSLRAQVAAHGHASPAEYIAQHVASDQIRVARKDPETKLLEGLASPTVPVDGDFWDSIRRSTERIVPNEPMRA